MPRLASGRLNRPFSHSQRRPQRKVGVATANVNLPRQVMTIRLFRLCRHVASLSSLSVLTLLALLTFPQQSQASVGVGVQAGPVSLTTAAQPGQSYMLPPVHVANTGSQAESITVRVEHLSPGPGRPIPPSWIHIGNSPLRLSPNQGAEIPLNLVVPDDAKSGKYLSDIVAIGSALIPAGRTNFGAAAATKLEFKVVPRTGNRVWSTFPSWTWWALTGLLLLAAARLAAVRSGLQIRIERKNADGFAINRAGRPRA